MKLLELFKTKSEGEALLQRLIEIKEKARPLLSKTIETFPEYTSHDISHSERIIEFFDFIIPESLIEKLNIYEIFFLVTSAYLHDIGMVNFPEFWDSNKIYNPHITEIEKVKDAIRENHHLRSEEFIVNNFKDLAIEDGHQAKIVGRICRGHRKENLHNNESYNPNKIYQRYPINVPLLAAILRICDDLDLTFERTPQIIYDKIPLRDTISINEWEKQLSISGVALNPTDPLIINCSANCKNSKIHRALKGLETKINDQLNELPYHLYQYSECRNDIPRTFLMEIEPEGYTPYDFKFSLQEKEIINLLMGEKLYKNKVESIRELLKNSVDACRFRKYLYKKNGVPYTPLIKFEITEDKDKLIITDNGIGMDKDVIERYFTQIGKSFYSSQEFLEKEFDFTPVNELGIGILSYFMIANRIVVETKMDDNNPMLIEIDDVSDYFFVKEGNRKNTGTTTTLYLKENAKKIDFEEQIRKYARHLDIQIDIKFSIDEEYTIDDVGYNPDVFLEDKIKKYGFYLNRINEKNVEGVIGILLRKNKNRDLLPIKTTFFPNELSQLKKKYSRFYISHEGIFVNNLNVVPKWLLPLKIFIDLNLKGNVLDLNVSRNDIVQNDKLEDFESLIEDLIFRTIQDYFNKLKLQAGQENVNLYEIYGDFFKNYMDRYSTDDEILEKSVQLVNFFKEYIYFKSISKDGIICLNYYEIMESDKPLRLLDPPRIGLKQFEHIFIECSGFSDNKLYIIEQWENYKLIQYFFKNISCDDFLRCLGKKNSNELNDIKPKTWMLARFKKYKTSKFMEFLNPTILNRDNLFIDLLIKNKDIIKGDKKIALEGFFRTLKHDLKNNPDRILSKQREILKWFIDAKLINEHELKNYILTKDDFPD